MLPEVYATFQAKSLRKLIPFYLWERELLAQLQQLVLKLPMTRLIDRHYIVPEIRGGLATPLPCQQRQIDPYYG
jgi:hypothetical protein